MFLGPHAIACALEIAAQMPLASRGLSVSSRLAAPLVLRRVHRLAAGVLVHESAELVGELLEDSPCGLMDVLLGSTVVLLLLVAALWPPRAVDR